MERTIMNRPLFALALILILTCSSFATAGVLHVPGEYAQIHDAVQACDAGDTVLVAAGTYFDCVHPTEGPESTPACVIMKSGVTLIGAGPEQTIIDAEGLGRGIFIEFVDNCRVENLQVRNAFAAIYGAGILIRDVDTTVEITDVRVTNCTDGGIICINNSSPSLRNVTMDHCAAKQGGGLSIEENSSPLVIDCIVNENTAPSGAGIFMRNNCAPTLRGCEVNFNTIVEGGNTYGGGISIQSSTPTISNCEIRGNIADGFGGGVAYADGSAGVMEYCLIQGNDNVDTDGQGGGIFVSASNPNLRHLVIADNTISGIYGTGGGMYISWEPSPNIKNCTIVGNACGADTEIAGGGGVMVEWGAVPTIDKCIISGSTVGEGILCGETPISPDPVVTCTDIFGNAGGDALCGTDGGGNFSSDPLFCGNAGYEYNLTASSPCAPGNHPGGPCDNEWIGALGGGCGETQVPLPDATDLVLGNHPNPFNPRTTIFFELPEPGPATLRIFDLAGRLVLERTWDDLPAGLKEFAWNGLDGQGRALASGVFLYRLDTRDRSLTQRMSLIR
jgi:hypothetical protein